MESKINLTYLDKEEWINLTQEELSSVEGGHVGYYVSFAMGPTYHATWMLGYCMGAYL